MKISRHWSLRSGDGSERQDAKEQESKSHFVSSFRVCFSFLLPREHPAKFSSGHFYRQSIHDAVEYGTHIFAQVQKTISPQAIISPTVTRWTNDKRIVACYISGRLSSYSLALFSRYSGGVHGCKDISMRA